MSRFLAVAWTIHSDLIPREVECVVPELETPFMEGLPPLYLYASELIHSKRDTL
jgi:hypothetical protein